MTYFRTAAFLAGCALIVACESQPGVIFVADGSDFDVMGLTDAQDTCNTPGRLAYLSWWDGETLRGCWFRERGEIRVCFPGLDDRLIPAGEFRPTEFASYRGLDQD